MLKKLPFLLFIFLSWSAILLAQPTTISPTDGNTGLGTVPTFSWDNFAAGDYGIEVFRYDLAAAAVTSSSPITFASLPWTSGATLLKNTKYSWYITDINAATKWPATPASPYTNGYTFTTALDVPVQSSPADLAVSVALNPTLTWTMSGNISNVDFYIDYDTDGSGGGWDNTIGPVSASTSTGLTGLSGNTTYYWQVRAVVNDPGADNDMETTTTVAEFSFTTVTGPSTITPVNNSTGVALSSTFEWDNFNSTTTNTYDIEIYEFGASGVTVFSEYNIAEATPVQSSVSGLANNTKYSWYIYDDAAATWYPATPNVARDNGYVFFTSMATASLTTPSDGATAVNLYAEFDWTMAGNYSNVDFEVEYSESVTFTPSTTVATSGTGVIGLKLVTPLDKSTVYYWRVIATVDNPGEPNDGESTTSSAFSFTSSPTYANFVKPVPGITAVSILPEFEWTTPDAATNFDFYLAEDLNFTSVLVTLTGPTPGMSTSVVSIAGDGKSGTVTLNEIDHPVLDNKTKYYWKIISTNGSVIEDTTHFTTYEEFTVYLSNPSDGVTEQVEPATGIPFGWYTTTYTTNMRFDLQICLKSTPPTASDWANTALTITYADINGLTQDVTGLIGGKTYYWRVVAKKSSPAGEIIKYSAVYSLNTAGGTNIVITPSWPIGGARIYTLMPTLNWYLDRDPTGFTFEVLYSTSVDINGDLVGPSTLVVSPATDLEETFSSALDADTRYYWQVEGTYSYTLPDATPATETVLSDTASFYTANTGNGIPIKPLLSYPVDGVTLYTTAPYVYWYLAADGTGLSYEIEVKPFATPFDATGTITTGANVYEYQLVGLTPGETYHWRVRSDNGTTQSSWSDEETFTIIGGFVDSYPVASWPVQTPSASDKPVVYTVNPELNWFVIGSTLGFTKFTVKWYKSTSDPGNDAWWTALSPAVNNADEGEDDITPVTTLDYTIPVDLDYGEEYYWAVAAYDGSSYSAWSEGSFKVTDGGPSSYTVVASAPINGVTVGETSTNLYWYVLGDVDAVDKYKVIISPSDVFWPSVTDEYIVNAPTQIKNVTGLIPGSYYYWKVGVSFDNGVTYPLYSDTEYFIVAPGSSAAQPLVGGPNNVAVSTTSPTLSWFINTAVSANLTYELEISDNPEFINSQFISNIAAKQYTMNDLVPGTNYFWRVRSKVDGPLNDNSASFGISLFSNNGAFKVADGVTSVDEKIIPETFAVEQNYPNPFNPETTIKYSIPENTLVTIRIYNILGQEVKTLINEEHSAGLYRINWKGDDNKGNKVTSGTYLYRVTAGSKVQTKKMVLLK